MNEQGIVEAAVFSAGRVVTIEEVAAATKLPAERVREALHALEKAYDARASAIEIARVGDKWTMQIRAEYAVAAEPFAPPEVPRDLLKTLALIAYHQPLKQSDLFNMVGSKVYEQAQALEQLRLISRKPSGRTFELLTTRYFVEFFGVRTTDRDGIRRLLAERAGVKYVEPPKTSQVPGEATGSTADSAGAIPAEVPTAKAPITSP